MSIFAIRSATPWFCGARQTTLASLGAALMVLSACRGGGGGGGGASALPSRRAPSITDFMPPSGRAGAVITVTGSGFTSTYAVSLGGTPARRFAVASDTLLTLTVAAGAQTGPITVSTLGGTVTSTQRFTFEGEPAPTLEGFAPGSGRPNDPVTLTGTGFTGTTQVTFGGVAALIFSENSDTELLARVPAGAVTGPVAVTTPRGTAVSATSFQVLAPAVNPKPVLTGVAPDSGQPYTMVTLTGSGLRAANQVAFGGVPTFIYYANSDTEIRAMVPGTAVTGPITVGTPYGSGTSGQSFTVEAALPRGRTAIIDAFAPLSSTAYGVVTLVGAGFTGTTQVSFGGVKADPLIIVDDTQLLAGVPPGAGTGPITVTTPLGVVQTADAFTFDPGLPSPPHLQSMLPVSGQVGSKVTLSGKGFLFARSVRFGEGLALVTAPTRDDELEVTVPPGARSGPVLLTSLTGTAISAESFTVEETLPDSPIITDFNPKSGKPGVRIEIQGRGLARVTAVRIGGQNIASIFHYGDTEIGAWVSTTDPASGSLSVTSPWGTFVHPTPFTLVHDVPVIRSYQPLSGPVGALVSISGTHLEKPLAVSFGDTPATDIRSASSTQIRVAVPAGATRGAISVLTAGGQATSTGSFTVRGGTLAQVQIERLYLNQATQRLDGSIPLVAGREGMLRVYLSSDRPTPVKPVVRVTLSDAQGSILMERDLRQTGNGVPTVLQEDHYASSWNLAIPGHHIQPGLKVLARILPETNLTLAPDGAVFPADGKPLPLRVMRVPPIGITLIPVRTPDGVGRVDQGGRSLASWMQRAKAIYPFADLDVQVGPVYNTNRRLGLDFEAYAALRNELEALRLAGNPANRRFVYGVFKHSGNNALLGLADFPDSRFSNRYRTAVGTDAMGLADGENYGETFAHELGHLLNRRHSPCGTAAGPDPLYPHAGATLGSAGFAVASGTTINPMAYKDVMSYCSPQWISDYTYLGVLNFRVSEPMALGGNGFGAAASSRPEPSLLVWGSQNEGILTLNPCFETVGLASQPTAGDYTLLCLDANRNVLQEVAFEPQLGADLPEGVDLRSFVFTIPNTPAMQAGLASLEVRRKGEVLATLAATVPGPAQGARSAAFLGREPVAKVWGPGIVHLGWDAERHPRVIVKDAATGENLALAEGGSIELATEARSLELLLSDGLRTRKVGVTVVN